MLTLFVVLVLVHSLVSARLERTVLTAPIVFTTVGLCVPLGLLDARLGGGGLDAFLKVAEVGLVLLLFTDASRTDLAVLKSIRSLPTRLLSTGMLLTIVFGALGALVILRGLTIWEAGILSAILAPTDAGLGQVIVTSPRVPMAVRQALNVEAGLNDGLSVPFLLFFIALAVGGVGAAVSGGGAAAGPGGQLTRFILEQLGLGAAIGAGIGLAGGWLIGAAQRRGWMADASRQAGMVALPLLCALLSDAIGASMFIAAFVAGLTVQIGCRDAGRHSVEFTEQWGQLFNLSVFFLFGVLVARAWDGFTAAMLVYALFSLTVARMVPVALALLGTRLGRASVLFMGWFGPRGLASIVLGLVYLEHEARLPGETVIAGTVMVTVLLSIYAHGLSALPGIGLYARRIAGLGPDAPEREGG
jgi:NhaP-type Na+/H+ or K+/H+ antiporter